MSILLTSKLFAYIYFPEIFLIGQCDKTHKGRDFPTYAKYLNNPHGLLVLDQKFREDMLSMVFILQLFQIKNC